MLQGTGHPAEKPELTPASRLACEQAHLIGKGGGAAIASRRSRREEWGEEK